MLIQDLGYKNCNNKRISFKQTPNTSLTALLKSPGMLKLSFTGDNDDEVVIQGKPPALTKDKFLASNPVEKLKSLATELSTININDDSTENMNKYTECSSEISQLLHLAKSFDINLGIDAQFLIDNTNSVMAKKNAFTSPGIYNSVLMNPADMLYEAYYHVDDTQKRGIENTFLNFIKDDPLSGVGSFATRFFYETDQHQDKELKKLTEIVKSIKQLDETEEAKYIKLRNDLLNQEFLILCQEVCEPEKYLDRAIKMGALSKVPSKHEDALLKLQIGSVKSLTSMSIASKALNINLSSYPNLINKLLEFVKDSDNSNAELSNRKLRAFMLLTYQKFVNLDEKQKEILEEVAFKFLTNASNDFETKKIMLDFFEYSVNKDKPVIKDLQKYFLNQLNSSNVAESNLALIGLAKTRYSGLNEIVREILNNKDSEHSLKITSAWIAGLPAFRDSNNYNILNNVINQDTYDTKAGYNDLLELKEMALYALSEYKDKPVAKILEGIVASKTELYPQASELLRKLNDKFKKEDNYCLNKSGLPEKEKEEYIKLRSQYMPTFDSFNSEEKNWIDKALIPFRVILKTNVNRGNQFWVINDLPTAAIADERGKRMTYAGGPFWDIAGGISSEDYGIVIPKHYFHFPSNFCFTFGHEWGHAVLNYIARKHPEYLKRLEQIYNNAKANNKCMDYYSATTMGEYFAQGMDAFLSPYKPYFRLIDANDYNSMSSHTKGTLERQDPDLYKLIQDIYDKFSSQSILEPKLNIVA